MQIRPLDRSEVESLVDELWAPLADRMAELSQYNALTDDARDRALAFRREQFEADDVRTLVAVDDGKLVGYVSGEVQPTPPIFQRGEELYVSELYVKEHHRRTGVGSDLLGAIATLGREEGCETVSVSVDVRNAAGRELFEASDFGAARVRYRRAL